MVPLRQNALLWSKGLKSFDVTVSALCGISLVSVLCFGCLPGVLWLFLAAPWVGLRCVIVVFPHLPSGQITEFRDLKIGVPICIMRHPAVSCGIFCQPYY